MLRYGRMIFPVDGLSLRTCKSRDPYRVRIYKFEEYPETYYQYSNYFYKAAHQIASYLIETDAPDISELDTFFFPLAFLYRHSMELLMKAIGFQNIDTVEKRKEFINGSFHNLSKIFCEIETCSIEKRNQDEMNWLRTYFESLSKMDRESDSFSFRYPFHIVIENDLFGTSYGIKRIFEKQTHIDLVKFANKFEACPDKPSLEADISEETAYTYELLASIQDAVGQSDNEEIKKMYQRIKELLDTDQIRKIRSKNDEDARFGHKTPTKKFL